MEYCHCWIDVHGLVLWTYQVFWYVSQTIWCKGNRIFCSRLFSKVFLCIRYAHNLILLCLEFSLLFHDHVRGQSCWLLDFHALTSAQRGWGLGLMVSVQAWFVTSSGFWKQPRQLVMQCHGCSWRTWVHKDQSDNHTTSCYLLLHWYVDQLCCANANSQVACTWCFQTKNDTSSRICQVFPCCNAGQYNVNSGFPGDKSQGLLCELQTSCMIQALQCKVDYHKHQRRYSHPLLDANKNVSH